MLLALLRRSVQACGKARRALSPLVFPILIPLLQAVRQLLRQRASVVPLSPCNASSSSRKVNGRSARRSSLPGHIENFADGLQSLIRTGRRPIPRCCCI